MILESLFHRIVAIAGILQSITDQAESRVRRVVPSFFYFSLFFRCVICLQYLEPPSIRWTAVDGEGTRRRFGASRSAASPVRRRTFKEISIIYKRYRLPRDVQWSFNNAEEDVTERKERDSFVTRGKLISQTLRNTSSFFLFLARLTPFQAHRISIICDNNNHRTISERQFQSQFLGLTVDRFRRVASHDQFFNHLA